MKFPIEVKDYGKCRIIRCSLKFNPIIRLKFEDDSEKTFSTSILTKSVHVLNDKNGVKLQELIGYVEEALSIPEKIYVDVERNIELSYEQYRNNWVWVVKIEK